MALVGAFAQLRPHSTRLDRGQLVFITQQHQARPQRHAGQEPRHHLQVNHGGFVHHHQVGGQRLRHGARPAGLDAQQAVKGLRLAGGIGLQGGTESVGQFVQGITQGRAEACGRLACGRGQVDAQGLAGSNGLALQQGQQAGHGGGFAGAGAAGQQQQTATRRQGTGDFLPVGL
jgi:hypothetical protein